MNSAVSLAKREHTSGTTDGASSAAAQIEAENEGELEDPNPNAKNRLKPLPGSTTKKPEAPPQRKVPAKPPIEHTEVSLKSDKCRKKRDPNEDIHGAYLTQAYSESDDDCDEWHIHAEENSFWILYNKQ